MWDDDPTILNDALSQSFWDIAKYILEREDPVRLSTLDPFDNSSPLISALKIKIPCPSQYSVIDQWQIKESLVLQIASHVSVEHMLDTSYTQIDDMQKAKKKGAIDVFYDDWKEENTPFTDSMASARYYRKVSELFFSRLASYAKKSNESSIQKDLSILQHINPSLKTQPELVLPTILDDENSSSMAPLAKAFPS